MEALDLERQMAQLKMLASSLGVEAARLTGIERVNVQQRITEVERQVRELERQADAVYSVSDSPTDVMADLPILPAATTDGLREQIAGLRRDVTRLQAQVDVLVTDTATIKADLRYLMQELSERKGGTGLDSRLVLAVLVISTLTVFATLIFTTLQ